MLLSNTIRSSLWAAFGKTFGTNMTNTIIVEIESPINKPSYISWILGVAENCRPHYLRFFPEWFNLLPVYIIKNERQLSRDQEVPNIRPITSYASKTLRKKYLPWIKSVGTLVPLTRWYLSKRVASIMFSFQESKILTDESLECCSEKFVFHLQLYKNTPEEYPFLFFVQIQSVTFVKGSSQRKNRRYYTENGCFFTSRYSNCMLWFLFCAGLG